MAHGAANGCMYLFPSMSLAQQADGACDISIYYIIYIHIYIVSFICNLLCHITDTSLPWEVPGTPHVVS